MRRPPARPLAFAALALVTVALVSVALSYWAGTGTGTVSTELADAELVILTAGTPSAELYPGGTASVAVVVENPNPFTVAIGSLSLDTEDGPGFEVDAGHSGCDVSVLGFTTQDNGGDGWMVPPKVGSVNGSHLIDATEAMTMGWGAAQACQGATFTVHLIGNP